MSKKSVPPKGLSPKVPPAARLGPKGQTKFTTGELGRAKPYGARMTSKRKHN